ncbi:MAG TPA: histidine phosphatase family protein [Acidimicrobiales bacterium]|nr:histidine phosphatase family protein [Acidimicrobiales bacterium]
MPRLILVRHGEPTNAWGELGDPGLSERGRAQAEACAEELAPLGPLPIVVSPARRTRDTAAPLERRWGVVARVEPAVGEVPIPSDVADPRAWLERLLAAPPDAWDGATSAWAKSVREALARIEGDAVVFTHFVAIRVATGADCLPEHCGRFVVEVG